jgi:hypothetical protein
MFETGRLLTPKESLRRSFQRSGPSRGVTALTFVIFVAAALLAVGASLFDLSEERIAGEQELRELLSIEPAAPPPSVD